MSLLRRPPTKIELTQDDVNQLKVLREERKKVAATAAAAQTNEQMGGKSLATAAADLKVAPGSTAYERYLNDKRRRDERVFGAS